MSPFAGLWARAAKLFGRQEAARVIFMGLDAAGKTTILYMLKLGEVVTTIPTIGFNVETIQSKGLNITAWDVGGCDKIRPLWRHYMCNTGGVVFVMDSNDHERGEDAAEELSRFLREDELLGVPVLVFANKQDLPNAMSVQRVREVLQLDDIRGHRIHVQASTATAGEGIYEGLEWLAAAIKDNRRTSGGAANAAAASSSSAAAAKPPTVSAATTSVSGSSAASGAAVSTVSSGHVTTSDGLQAAQLHAVTADVAAAALKQFGRPGGPTAEQLCEKVDSWLAAPDEDSDDQFLAALEGCTLVRWDHYAHLRIAWAYLVRHGRREGMRRIFASIRNYIAHGPATSQGGRGGNTFHETMTYFWAHMVHYALASATAAATAVPAPAAAAALRSSFPAFLRASPHLADGGLFLKYYTHEALLKDPVARSQVVLPTLAPLPSLITTTTSDAAANGNRSNHGASGSGGALAGLKRKISSPFTAASAPATSRPRLGDIVGGSIGGNHAAGAPLSMARALTAPTAPPAVLNTPAALTDAVFINKAQSGSLSGWGPELQPRPAYCMYRCAGGPGYETEAIELYRTVLQGLQGEAAYDEAEADAVMQRVLHMVDVMRKQAARAAAAPGAATGKGAGVGAVAPLTCGTAAGACISMPWSRRSMWSLVSGPSHSAAETSPAAAAAMLARMWPAAAAAAGGGSVVDGHSMPEWREVEAAWSVIMPHDGQNRHQVQAQAQVRYPAQQLQTLEEGETASESESESESETGTAMPSSASTASVMPSSGVSTILAGMQLVSGHHGDGAAGW